MARVVVQLASKADAFRNPSAHTFIPKVGYVKLGQPANFGLYDPDRCKPPAGTLNKSEHALQPPGGAAPVKFIWVVKLSTWQTDNMAANRLGFTTSYLSSHGWTYLGPVK